MIHKNSKLENPFIVTRSIPDELFCDRKEETDFLIKQIRNGRNVVLVSPRRMGKTGLIQHLFRQPDIRDHYHTFFVDIYAASSLQEMCYLLGKTVFERLKSRKERHWESFLQTLKSLRGGFRIDRLTGEPTLEISLGSISQPEVTLNEIFEYLEKANQPCLVAFDEFQQIAEFRESRVEALLRGLIQQCAQTSFIFSGSRQHTIQQMFHSKTRPFYQSAQMINLSALDKEVYTTFAQTLFVRYNKQVDNTVIHQVYDTYNGTTWYLQMMMNELFSITASGTQCTNAAIDAALHNIILAQDAAYRSQIAELSTRQKSVLQAIATAGPVQNVTSAAFVKRFALESPSSVQSAIRALENKEILSREENGYRIHDYFFKDWIQQYY